MKIIRLTTASNFIGIQGDVDAEVLPYIKEHLKKVASNVDVSVAPEWSLTVCLMYDKSDWTGVFKRGITYRLDKEKYMSITIPIPTQDIVSYRYA